LDFIRACNNKLLAGYFCVFRNDIITVLIEEDVERSQNIRMLKMVEPAELLLCIKG
jgi:hypothetical protein